MVEKYGQRKARLAQMLGFEEAAIKRKAVTVSQPAVERDVTGKPCSQLQPSVAVRERSAKPAGRPMG